MYHKLKEHFSDTVEFVADIKDLPVTRTKEYLYIEGCWEDMTQDIYDRLNEYKMVFMCLAPDHFTRLPLPALVDIPEPSDFQSRDIDVFFCGEGTKGFNWINDGAGVVCEVGTWTRHKMLVEALTLTDRKCVLLPQKGFGGKVIGKDYTDFLNRTKIALCPRGSVYESYRMTEAALCGCIVVTTPPDASMHRFGSKKIPWYFEDAPVVVVDQDWSNLKEVLDGLTPEIMLEIHQKTLKWARECLSEEAMETLVRKYVTTNRV